MNPENRDQWVYPVLTAAKGLEDLRENEDPRDHQELAVHPDSLGDRDRQDPPDPGVTPVDPVRQDLPGQPDQLEDVELPENQVHLAAVEL